MQLFNRDLSLASLSGEFVTGFGVCTLQLLQFGDGPIDRIF